MNYPDYLYRDVSSETVRADLLNKGSLVLRGAIEPANLDKIYKVLDLIYAETERLPAAERQRLAGSHDTEQIRRGHVYDPEFSDRSGFSYFDPMKESGLWSLLSKSFPESILSPSITAGSRRVRPDWEHQFRTWERVTAEAAGFHVDAQYHYHHMLNVNIWTPLHDCGVCAPSLSVALASPAETARYLDYSPEGYEPRKGDTALMHHFRTERMQPHLIQQAGYAINSPVLRKGDVLILTNFTMHGTFMTSAMTQPRTSVELRIDLPGVFFDRPILNRTSASSTEASSSL